jgi:hypothetical protein
MKAEWEEGEKQMETGTEMERTRIWSANGMETERKGTEKRPNQWNKRDRNRTKIETKMK